MWYIPVISVLERQQHEDLYKSATLFTHLGNRVQHTHCLTLRSKSVWAAESSTHVVAHQVLGQLEQQSSAHTLSHTRVQVSLGSRVQHTQTINCSPNDIQSTHSLLFFPITYQTQINKSLVLNLSYKQVLSLNLFFSFSNNWRPFCSRICACLQNKEHFCLSTFGCDFFQL